MNRFEEPVVVAAGFSVRSSFVPAALIVASLLCVSTVNAQAPQCYTLASIQGEWALVNDYGDKVAIAIGRRSLDATGNITGTFVQNQPAAGSTTGERTISSGTNAGTYAINCDGSGTVTRTVTSTLGTVTNPVDDFLISRAVLKDGQLIATEIVDAQRTPSALVPGGIFVTRVHTRLPDMQSGKCYTLDSLQGSYGVSVMYGAKAALGLQPESLDGEGNLFRTGINNQPVTGSATGDRTVGKVTSVGTYAVNCNGSGKITRSVTRPDGTTASAVDDFVITGAMEQDGRLIATSIMDAQQASALVGPDATFVTRTHILRPDPNAQLEIQLQSIACGTKPPAQSCRVSVNTWNYFLLNRVNPKALVLISGDGTEMITVRRYLGARTAAGL